MLYIFVSEAFSTIICLQDLNFNAFQNPGAVGADDLTAEPGIDQAWDPGRCDRCRAWVIFMILGHSSALSVTKGRAL
jgi:hypothetical protein